MKFKYYAIDFDDTIAFSDFPLIKTEVPHAGRVMRRIKDNGGQISIWTCRTGAPLEDARHFLESNNIPYDLMNEPFPEIAELFGGSGRKIFADIYIDDKGVDTIANGGIDWLKIENMIFDDNKFDVEVTLETLEGKPLYTGMALTKEYLDKFKPDKAKRPKGTIV